jgi:hypothetical protein
MIEESENNEEIKHNNKAAWYKVSGYCTFFISNEDPRPMFYLACPACKKKVVDESGGYRCENC